jgi:hypothetical protein
MVLGLGCNSLDPSSDETRQARRGVPPVMEAEPTDGRGGGAGPLAPDVTLSLGGAVTVTVPPEPDLCAVAAQNGAIFCEPGEATLEYCIEAPQDGAPCPGYDRPPVWLYDLLIQCVAHCGVGIATSERELDGACCYFGESEHYGR